MRHHQSAFTLLEVLIALAILAIVLSAAFRGINLTASQAAELGTRHMAQWIAQNRLAELRLTGTYPDLGATDGSIEQGGLVFRWQQNVSAMDQPLFRRVDVKVLTEDGTQVAALIGVMSQK